MAGRRLGRALGLLLVIGSACALNNLKFDDEVSAGSTSSISTSSSTIASATDGPTTDDASASDTSDTSTGGTASDSATTGTTSTTSTGTGETTGDPTTTGDASTTAFVCDEEDKVPLFVDLDDDGFGDAATMGCVGEPGLAEVGGDCDDDAPAVYPGAPEHCDGLDNNCNQLADEADAGLTQCDASGSLCHLAASGGRYYYACTGPLKPSEAHAKCQSFAVGDAASAFHVKIESAEENGLLKGLVPMLGGDTSIGLTADPMSVGAQISDYHWIVDDAPIEGFGGTKGADPWESGQPNWDLQKAERWVVIRGGNLGWNNTDDDTARPFLCEAIPG